MRLSIPQIALMSHLLDEALPLDAAERRDWLEKLCPEYQDLVPALRKALFPEAAQSTGAKFLATLPKLGATDDVSAPSGLQAGVPVGPYELIRLLGAGGMAEVWLARRADGALKREVALKLPTLMRVRKDLQQRFARERDILASLEHPHIARLYDAGINVDGMPYLAMEYVQGQPLTDWCDAHTLAISERLKLFLQVLEAVQFAHEKHVIHRDLKPSNILVTESGQARLLDFGVAKLLETNEADETQLTGVFGRALTPDYASPELLQGEPIDVRSDIFSMGVVFYELLTGVRPYRLAGAASVGILKQAIAIIEVKRPSTQIAPEAVVARATTKESLARQLRGDLDAMALKALAKEPLERYPTTTAFMVDLQHYLEGKPIQAQPARFTYRLRKFVKRNRTVIGVSAAAVAALLVMEGYALYREAAYQVKVTAMDVAVSTPTIAPADSNSDAAAAVVAPSPNSVAVLPFVDMSEKKDQEYFSDGLTEELINLLSKNPDLHVPARTSSFYFKGQSEVITTIAQKLRVAHVLEGSVRKAGNRLRITAQLVRVGDGYHLWSETYDRDLDDVFKIQDEIAAAVVKAMQVRLLPDRPMLSARRTDNSAAYDEYLIAKQASDRGDSRLAVSAYQRAIALDPRFAAAYAGLALSESDLADTITGEKAAWHRALAKAERAVALAPDQPDGYLARGALRLVCNYDWKGGRADLEKAMAYDPDNNDVRITYGYMLGALGLLPEALAVLKKATDADPLSTKAWVTLGLFLMNSRQYAAARDALNRAHQIDPAPFNPRFHLAQTELLDGHAEKALEVAPHYAPPWDLVITAVAAHTLGRDAESQQALDSVISQMSQTIAYQITQMYSWRGETDKAFQWLERSYARRDSGLMFMTTDPFLDNIRSDARYAAMLKKMNLPEATYRP